jgi:hypothetical protein
MEQPAERSPTATRASASASALDDRQQRGEESGPAEPPCFEAPAVAGSDPGRLTLLAQCDSAEAGMFARLRGHHKHGHLRAW